MKASLKWVKEILPELTASVEEIDQKLTDAGIEVEEVVHQASALDKVVVAEVRALKPHPKADRLRLVTVFDGDCEHEVVCGAANVAVGQKIPFAKVGAHLPVGFTIEPRKIRGVESSGMICSEEELGFAEKSEGILVLDAAFKSGQSVAEVLAQDDVIFDLGVTPNRPDVLSQLGVARELAAVFGFELPQATAKPSESSDAVFPHIDISIEWPQRCDRYVGRVISGVKIGPSPDWVVRRLHAVGQRSISNVVDATNLALLETGHPLHAFDLKKLKGQKIIVRAAKEGELLKTLDEVERKLSADDLVIADAESPVALAGVMGGADSEVGAGTTEILLEAAMFNPTGIRRSAKRHGLHTEASHRFERGADALALDHAIDRCAELILEMAGGELKEGRVDVVEKAFVAEQCFIRPERASLVLGREVLTEEVEKVMACLGVKKLADKGAVRADRLEAWAAPAHKDSALFYEAPSWRVDLCREEDLIEEVARISGYHLIPTIMPSLPTAVWTEAPHKDHSTTVRNCMVGLGFYETISLAFNSAAQLEAMGSELDRAVSLANPLGEESAYMRMSLLPGQLKSAALNQSHGTTDLRFFEIGKTFSWNVPADSLPVEVLRLSLLMRGEKQPASWSTQSGTLDVFDLKGALQTLLQAFGVRDFECVPSAQAFLHPKTATEIRVGDRSLAYFGVLHPDAQERFDLDGPDVLVAELDILAMAEQDSGPSKFMALPKYPGVTRDLSFFIDSKTPVSIILAEAKSAADQARLETVDVFDVYEGKGMPEGKRSVAIRMSYRSSEGTLKDAEVDQAQESVAAALQTALGADIRRG